MSKNKEIFERGAQILAQTKIALDPYGKTWMDGYTLLLVDNDGEVYAANKPDSENKYKTENGTALDAFKKVNWSKESSPNTPSVEMLVDSLFESMCLKAYAMWAVSSKGVCASTHAVYESLNASEKVKMCDTMEACKDTYSTVSCITVR